MDLKLTLILGGVLIAFAAFCGWRGAKRPDPTKGPRLIPWRLLMILSAGGVLILLGVLSKLLKLGS